MRYTVMAADNEKALAAVDRDAQSEHCIVSIYKDDGSEGEKNAVDVVCRVEGAMMDLVASDGTRFVFPAKMNPVDGTVVIATALGNIRFSIMRGALNASSLNAAHAHKAIKSSMPGKVLKLLCAVGDKVEAGQPLLIIEAMKMENEIRSPQAGVIEEIAVQAAMKVETGALLVKIGKAEGA